MRAKVLNGDPLYFVQRDLLLAAVVEHGGAGELVVGDVLRRFQGAVVLEVGGDPRFAAGTRGVLFQTGESELEVSFPPPRRLLRSKIQLGSDLFVAAAGGSQQHDSRPFKAGRQLSTMAPRPLIRVQFISAPNDGLQPRPLIRVQFNLGSNTHRGRPLDCIDVPKIINVTIYDALH